MKIIKFISTLVLILIPSLICLAQNITLTTQADVDAFDSSTTMISGDLTIGGTSSSYSYITDLSNLSDLTAISGNLTIGYTLSLPHVDALSNLTSIGGKLDLVNNGNLTSIDGLSSVASVGGDLDLWSNIGLINVDGLSGITSVGGSLYLTNNFYLTNINGLSSITSVGGSLSINSNHDLTDIDGLSNITSVGMNLNISYNDSLSSCCAIQYLLVTPNAIGGSINISNNTTPCDSQNSVVTQDCGNYFNLIQGNVFLDINVDCLLDVDDIPYENIIIQAESAEYIYTTVSDSLGNYQIYLDTGYYNVVAYMTNPYTQTCVASYPVDIIDDTVSDTFNFDFPAIVNIYCPYLDVDIGTWALRECFDNTYTVQYCNSGTLEANNAYVELELDSVLSVASASIPFTGPDLNNIYTFDVGTIGIGDCGNFNINIQLPCDTLNAGQFFGQTLCVNAHIYPNSVCFPPSSVWDGSSVQATVECIQDSVVFKLRNIGVGDMLSDKTFYIFEDQVMFDTSLFQLNAGEEIVRSYFANGSTFRLDAEQSDGHPGMSQPSVVVEACGAGPSFSLGFVNQFSQDDGDIFVSTECIEVTGSYDPNDKQATPVGYGEAHYIEKNTDIEYKIRFQNTGTDTAFTVVIQDEISPLFDITTIQPGASSHPYSFEIDTVVRFVFNDILLVDSFTNEPASHGFVKFRISQEADLPIGTVIENTAGIYFDFNAPIITNTTFHTIGEDFITINLISNIPDIFQLSAAKAYPNPFSKSITFELEGVIEEEVVLSVYDVNGKEVARENYDSSIFEFSRGRLMSGVYFYMISSDGIGLAKGKMILQH